MRPRLAGRGAGDGYACVSGNYTFGNATLALNGTGVGIAMGGNKTDVNGTGMNDTWAIVTRATTIVREPVTNPPPFNETIYPASTWRVNPEGKYSINETTGALTMVLRHSLIPATSGRYEGVATTLGWSRRVGFGKVRAEMDVGGVASGVVGAMVIAAPEGDEIDFEWVGANTSQVWTNWFRSGIPEYGRGMAHEIPGVDKGGSHEYGIEWTEDLIRWSVDSVPVRTIYRVQYPRPDPPYDGGWLFPTRRGDVEIGVWDGGSSNEGTREWAGGFVDWGDAGQEYWVKVGWVKVECW
ncbi:glycoside hydrolase family 16 protein [Gonapodya prolifera JEL478]|uniref:Glycoside hydrolase family 16 protein n=1 Tax=Gonapodya prolifera (strain JEL478) TaxID=1344416 RepID=A0A139ADQ0_GONPJ|nr:glycoside hydrolase family 16 protein [Gonapodya prolifera JEL478]|eukprot:KXS14565.1 glycoside hydrolase family 16 protein [Gonapodya prolifera JEL478]